MEKIRKIVLFGPQGSGKSTQAKVIIDFLGIEFISASQVLKDFIKQGSTLGQQIKEQMAKGQLIPDPQVIALVLEELKTSRFSKGFLLDGFPRSLAQAEALDLACGVDKVFNIEISDQEAVRRISGRRICDSGHVFHQVYQPSSKGELCDVCGAKLFQREDDKEEVIKKRLAIYREQSSQLIEHYSRQGKLVFFNGEKSIAAINHDIVSYLQENAG
ncbi:MAG: nucleoside monophosphate kinase [Patescibacteria group bacterium]|nr:nucleoside monophosphate kinase [Patescibacteria group bacterium]